MANGTRKKYTQVPKGLDHSVSKQSATRLFLRNKDVVPTKSYPHINNRKKNDAPSPEVVVRQGNDAHPANPGIVSRIVGKAVAYGMILVSLVTFGWIGTSTTHAQDKPKQEQVGKQERMTWGMVKSKVGGAEKKATEKTWVEKGEKKYDVTYDNGVVTFVNWDGERSTYYDMRKNPELIELVRTPLKMMIHAKEEGLGNGVYLVYDAGMIFIMPERTDGESNVRIKIMTKPDGRLTSLTK